MPRYVLGIDAGTESIRAAIFDEKRDCLSFGTSENKTMHKHPGRAEQSIPQWETSMIEAINQAIAKSGVSPDTIEEISVDETTYTVVFLDNIGKSLRAYQRIKIFFFKVLTSIFRRQVSNAVHEITKSSVCRTFLFSIPNSHRVPTR